MTRTKTELINELLKQGVTVDAKDPIKYLSNKLCKKTLEDLVDKKGNYSDVKNYIPGTTTIDLSKINGLDLTRDNEEVIVEEVIVEEVIVEEVIVEAKAPKVETVEQAIERARAIVEVDKDKIVQSIMDQIKSIGDLNLEIVNQMIQEGPNGEHHDHNIKGLSANGNQLERLFVRLKRYQ